MIKEEMSQAAVDGEAEGVEGRDDAATYGLKRLWQLKNECLMLGRRGWTYCGRRQKVENGRP